MLRRPGFWLNVFLPLLFVVLAAGLAFAWYANGGWPVGHDDNGVARVPGSTVLDLPEGETRIYWQADATGGGESRSVGERPEALKVSIAPVGGGAEADLSGSPSWTFSSISGDTGFEPYAEAEIERAGEYEIAARAPRNEVPPGGELTFGPPNWNPAGSLAAGTAMVAIAVLAFGAANWAMFRFAVRATQAGRATS